MFDPIDLIRTGNRYTDQYIAAAERLGLRTEVVSRSRSFVVIAGGGRKLAVQAAIVGCNGMVASRISANKFLTSSRLRNAGFRVPEFRLFCTSDYTSPDKMLRGVARFAIPRFPAVIKPVHGHSGAHVYAGVEDPEELSRAVDTVWKASLGDVLVEKHIHGRHYRIKLLDGTITDLIARYPASVTGDGRSSISELIEEKNRLRRKEHIQPITVTERMTRLLSRRGRTLESVLLPGETEQLCIESNQSLGGETERLPVGTIAGATADYLVRAARVTGLRWLAIDYIADDISDPLSSENGYINETNSALAPNEFESGSTIDDYLHPATLVLKKYFDLP